MTNTLTPWQLAASGAALVFAVMLLQSAEFRRQLRALAFRPPAGGLQ